MAQLVRPRCVWEMGGSCRVSRHDSAVNRVRSGYVVWVPTASHLVILSGCRAPHNEVVLRLESGEIDFN
jgi:hypothetical protein